MMSWAGAIDEVSRWAANTTVLSGACCAPNATAYLRAPTSSDHPAMIRTARNGTHEWVPFLPPSYNHSQPQQQPRDPVPVLLMLGDAGSADLNSGVTDAKMSAVLQAVAAVSGAAVSDVKVMDGGASHTMHPSVGLKGRGPYTSPPFC